MNATKRKFNALLQGMGTRPANATADTDSRLHKTTTADRLKLASRSSPAGVSTASIASNGNGNNSSSNSSNSNRRLTSDKPSASPSASNRTANTAVHMSSAAAELEFLAKRRRLAGSSPQAGSTTLRSSPGSIGLAKAAPLRSQTHTQQPQQPAPRYCPGDREQLLRRLATFQELTDWTPKPDRINEVEWARRGWVCQGKERLRCTLCSKEVVVRLGGRAEGKDKDKDDDDKPLAPLPDAEAALVDSYVERLATAHDDDCLWRKKGCDASLLRLPLANPRQALGDLRQRYDELCARKDFLPYAFNLRLPAGLDLDAVLASLPEGFFQETDQTDQTGETSQTSQTDPPNRTALALAVLGWQGLTHSRLGAVPNSASCHACLRRLGLWMFKSRQVDLATSTVLDPAPMDGLDGVREHRFFCPWRNGAMQRNPGGGGRANPATKTNANADDTPGWAVLVQVLKNDAYLRNRVAVATSGSRRLHKRPPGQAAGTTVPASPSASPAQPTTATAAGTPVPTTPVRRPTATAAVETPDGLGGSPFALADNNDNDNDNNNNDGEDEAARTAKDKERWARLRRVKSLFDPKGAASRRLKRGSRPGTATSRPGTAASRPGTATSARRPDTGASRAV